MFIRRPKCPTLDQLQRRNAREPEQFGPPRPPKFNRRSGFRFLSERELKQQFPDIWGSDNDRK